MFQDTPIAFIGSGIMAEAMIAGLINQNLVEPQHIIAAGPRQERGQTLAERYGIRTTSHNREAADTAALGVVVLAVKPQVLPHILPEIRGHVRTRALVLSIVAGGRIETIANGLAHAGVVRAMPNTPAQIGQGITVWHATTEVTPEQREQAQAMLGALGETVWVEDEDDLDKVTALSGTGPAYVFLFMEAMIDAGVH